MFSHALGSDSLQPHGPQHTRPPCPSPSLEICPSSSPLYRWCHPAISFSEALTSLCFQTLPAWGIFPKCWLFASDDQTTGASSSVLPMSVKSWFPLLLTGLISLLSKGLSGVFLSTTIWRHHLFDILLLYGPAFVHDHWDEHSLDYLDLVDRAMSLLFSTPSRFVIAFQWRRNHLLISWLQSSSAVVLEPKKRESVTTSTFSPSIWHEVMMHSCTHLTR